MSPVTGAEAVSIAAVPDQDTTASARKGHRGECCAITCIVWFSPEDLWGTLRGSLMGNLAHSHFCSRNTI